MKDSTFLLYDKPCADPCDGKAQQQKQPFAALFVRHSFFSHST